MADLNYGEFDKIRDKEVTRNVAHWIYLYREHHGIDDGHNAQSDWDLAEHFLTHWWEAWWQAGIEYLMRYLKTKFEE